MLTALALSLSAATGGIDLIETSEPLIGFAKRVDGATTAYAEVSGAPSAPFMLLAGEPGSAFDLETTFPLFTGILNEAGRASVAVAIPQEIASIPGKKYSLHAVYAANGQVFQPQPGQTFVGGSTGAQLLDFDCAPGFDEPQPGQQVDDEYAQLGINISAVNNTGSPNKAILFDSSNPTGDDFDLATPGFGTANDEALGQLLIIAENDADANNDGLVDVPDDEMAGGVITLDFDEPTEVESIRVVDIDEQMPSEIRIVQDGVPGMTVFPLNDVGDNGVQEVLIGLTDVSSLGVYFGGSGAIADVLLFPCPIVLDFDETPFGKPLGVQTGETITDQFAAFGITFSAEGTNSPDKAIIFDSGNPTGGDFDLQTPGFGANNDTFLGNLLILAEDDVDADMDGLVDDPDDAQDGGFIRFNFDQNVTFFGFQVIDVDSKEIDAILLFDEFDNVLVAADLGPIGENSVQSFDVDGGVPGVRRGEFFFSGSGGIDEIRYCPDGSEPPTPK